MHAWLKPRVYNHGLYEIGSQTTLHANRNNCHAWNFCFINNFLSLWQHLTTMQVRTQQALTRKSFSELPHAEVSSFLTLSINARVLGTWLLGCRHCRYCCSVRLTVVEVLASANQISWWPHQLPVGNKKLPQLPWVCGGMSGQEQQQGMHATKRQWEWWRLEWS